MNPVAPKLSSSRHLTPTTITSFPSSLLRFQTHPKSPSPPRSRRTQQTMTTAVKRAKQFWLLKTEPGEWSWEDQSANAGVSNWDGVKNKQAQKNLKSMRLGDLCFFYHSGARARRVVGVVTVAKEWYEPAAAGEGVVDVKAVGEMRKAVDLKEMKGDDGLKGFALFRQPRLSVVPVPEDVWERVCELGGGFDGDGKGDCGGEEEE